jgi:tripartite-type tricarboxylate transporter receptor subunit TctC
MKRLWRLLPAILLGIAAIPAVAADPVADFYRGKTITLVISVGEGDGMDRTARILARHWPDTIPGNPTIIAKNMPGAGSLRATEYLYTQAPKDGTVLGALIPVFVLQQAMGGGTAGSINYDAAKFGWIGSSNTSNQMVYVWHTAGVETLQQAMEQELLMGATGAGSNSVLYPTILNNVLGTRFKIIMGYRAAPEIGLAMERGEVQGRAGESFNTLMAVNPDWVRDKKIGILVQIGVTPEPGFESVPLITDFAKDAARRSVLQLFSQDIGLGRPYLAPPGIPAERLAALRTSFDAAMKDPALLAEAKQSHLDISPTEGEALQKLVTGMLATQPEVLSRAKTAMDAKNSIAGEKPAKP